MKFDELNKEWRIEEVQIGLDKKEILLGVRVGPISHIAGARARGISL